MNAVLVNPADFDLVLARWLRDTERTAPDRLLLTFDPAAAPALLELADRVPHGITVGLEDGQLLAEITVPDEHGDLLDGIVLRTETADLRALQRHLAG
jgi:NADPH-dependent ferric siderophore reductase